MIPTIAVRRPLPQETTRDHKRPQSHDTQCLWERSPDCDFCNGPCRKSAQKESLGRRLRCAPAALKIIVEPRPIDSLPTIGNRPVNPTCRSRRFLLPGFIRCSPTMKKVFDTAGRSLSGFSDRSPLQITHPEKRCHKDSAAALPDLKPDPKRIDAPQAADQHGCCLVSGSAS